MRFLLGYIATASWVKGTSTSAVALITAGALLEGAALAFLVPVLGLGSSMDFGQISRIALDILNVPPERTIAVCLIIFVCLGALSAGIRLASDLLLLSIRTRVESTARTRMTEALLSMRYIDLSKFGVGEIGKSIVMEGWQIGLGTQLALTSLGLALAVVAYLVVAASISPILTAYVFAFGLIAGAVYLLAGRVAKVHMDRLSSSISTIGDQVQELFGAIKYYKSSGRTSAALSIASRVYSDFAHNYFRGSAYGPIAKSVLDTTSLVILAVFLHVSLAIHGGSVAQTVVVLALFIRIMPRVVNAQDFLFQARTYFSWYETWKERLQQANASREQWTGRLTVPFDKDLRLEGVTVTYPGRPGVTLASVNASISRGECVAIIGPSGSGKSTVVDVVTGIVRPNSGEVFVDDIPLGQLDINSWRAILGIVLQDTPIVSGTVMENVVWGDSESSEERVIQCLKQAGAWSFVEHLSLGVHEQLNERGTQLSGGERQRIAVARALYRRPRLLIFDEATSALDVRAEQSVLTTLQSLKKHHAILWISHRIQTLEIADRVYKIENHQLVPYDATATSLTDPS